MDPIYQYTGCLDGIHDCATTISPCDIPEGWLWFGRNAEGKIEPTEVGQMPYSLLQMMVKFLEDCSDSEDSFTDEENILLSEGSELMLVAVYDSGDSDVGIPSGYEIDTQGGVSRKAVTLPDWFEESLSPEEFDKVIDQDLARNEPTNPDDEDQS